MPDSQADTTTMGSADQPDVYANIAHLYRRAAFGATPFEITQAVKRGVNAVTDELVNYESVPDTINDDVFLQHILDFEYSRNGVSQFRDRKLEPQTVKLWWIYRMLATTRPLQEKMVLFWHNHFTSKDDDGDYMLRQNKLYRTHALGNFRDLTLAVTKDPEMLRYLNGEENFKAHPNENYGRELMELFTCGRVGPDGKPNYTEDDIKNAARAFSGWNMRGGQFFFNADQHDDDPKTFMGHTGNFNGDDIVDMLVDLPNTGWYICRKLFRFFAYTDPEPAVLQGLVDTYFKNHYEIKPVVDQILRSPQFYGAEARNAIIKSPAQFLIGTLKMSGMSAFVAPPVDQDVATADPDDPMMALDGTMPDGHLHPKHAQDVLDGLTYLTYFFRNMGQDLLAPPNVKGWDGGPLWININTILSRAGFANYFAYNPRLRIAVPDIDDGSKVHTVEAEAHPAAADPERLVDTFLWQFGPLGVSDRVRRVLIDYASAEDDTGNRVRGVLALILDTTEYQVC